MRTTWRGQRRGRNLPLPALTLPSKNASRSSPSALVASPASSGILLLFGCLKLKPRHDRAEKSASCTDMLQSRSHRTSLEGKRPTNEILGAANGRADAFHDVE